MLRVLWTGVVVGATVRVGIAHRLVPALLAAAVTWRFA
jgi:hypothetical protein